MAEVLVEFAEPVLAEGGEAFLARACGSEGPGALWQGWIEFTSLETGEVSRTPRETTQPNRQDTLYWATGLTAVYLEGALRRALEPGPAPPPVRHAVPAFDGPAPRGNGAAPAPGSVLNPFSVYEKGEAVLRRQLAALSGWHLINILEAHGLSDQTRDQLGRLTDAALVELIVDSVKIAADRPTTPAVRE